MVEQKSLPDISGVFLVTRKSSAKEKYYHDRFLRSRQGTNFHFCDRSADKSNIKNKRK